MSTKETDNQLELLQGTLDLLILQTLAYGSAHGHAIAKSIEHRSEEVLQVGHGSLYPALQRLLKSGLIEAEDGVSENKALGAKRARVIAMVLRGAMIQTALGLAIGVPTALLSVRFIEAQLYEVKGADAGVLVVSTLTLLLATSIAGFIPARRAASIDPVQALRTE